MNSTQEYTYQDLALVEDFDTASLGVVQGWQPPQSEPQRLVLHGPVSAMAFVEDFEETQVIGWEFTQEEPRFTRLAAYPDSLLVEDFATAGLGVVQGWQHEQVRLPDVLPPPVASHFTLVEFSTPEAEQVIGWEQPQTEPVLEPSRIYVDVFALVEDFATPGLGVVQGWLREFEQPTPPLPPTPDSAVYHIEPQRGPSFGWWRPQETPVLEPHKPFPDDLSVFVEDFTATAGPLITGTLDADSVFTGTLDADTILAGTVDADTVLTGTIGGL